MNILAIETSCDETAAAIVKDGREVLSNVVASQIDLHKKFGGVVPEVAARAHVQSIIPVVEEALRLSACPAPYNGARVIPTDPTLEASGEIPFSKKNLDWDEIDAIAVTQGPGLIGSLIVGTETARTLAILKNKAFIAVNHLEGHVYANFIRKNPSSSVTPNSSSVIPAEAGIQNLIDSRRSLSTEEIPASAGMTREGGNDKLDVPQFPLIALLVSGGHTMLVYMKKHYKFEVIGSTRDDAAGEAFDKVAALLSLPYPGGPNISKLAEKGSPDKYKLPIVDLTPEPKRDKDGFLIYPEPSLDFSFSGLKTAVLNIVKQRERDSSTRRSAKSLGMTKKGGNDKASIAASFQKTLVDTLVQNSGRAIKKYKPSSFLLSGGVAANPLLRQQLQKMCSKADIEFHMPELKYCTDNAAMIGAAAFYKQKKFGFTKPKELTPNPNLKLA